MATVHAMTVERLAAKFPPGAQKGFCRSGAQGLCDHGDDVDVSIIPDLWWHEAGDGRDCDSGTIACIEVEDDNPISGAKLLAYADCRVW